MARKKLRDNVLIDNELYQSVTLLNNEQLGQVMRAVLEFGFERIEPTGLDTITQVIYSLATLRMAKVQKRYDSCVANGRNGGAPTGNKNAQKTTEKQPKTTEKQPKTTEKQPKTTEKQPKTTEKQPEGPKKTTKPSIINGNGKGNGTESDISVRQKNKNIFYLSASAGQKPQTHTPAERQSLLSVNYEYHKQDKFGDAMIEVADILLDLQEYAETQGVITHNNRAYNAREVVDLIAKKGKQVVDSVAQKIAINDTIDNHATYIASVLLS